MSDLNFVRVRDIDGKITLINLERIDRVTMENKCPQGAHKTWQRVTHIHQTGLGRVTLTLSHSMAVLRRIDREIEDMIQYNIAQIMEITDLNPADRTVEAATEAAYDMAADHFAE